MHGLVCLELEQQGVEGAQVVGGGVGVEVEDGGQAEAEQQVLCCAARLGAWGEGGQAREVGFGEEERVEPVDAAFVAGLVSEGVIVQEWVGRTPSAGSPASRCASRPARGCAGR